MESVSNFPLLLAQIRNYLEQPCASGQDRNRDAAIRAFNELARTLYPESSVKPCSSHPVIMPIA